MSMAGGDRTVGVDFGTLSGRAVVVRVADGEHLSEQRLRDRVGRLRGGDRRAL